MKFLIKLMAVGDEGLLIPINYQYPLSAAIYKIIAKGDAAYAQRDKNFPYKLKY